VFTEKSGIASPGNGIGCANLAKVDFIEHDLVRVADPPETGEESQKSDDGEGNLIVAV
jgi:hypothetical protein